MRLTPTYHRARLGTATLSLCIAMGACANDTARPAADWPVVEPAAAGWDSAPLDQLKEEIARDEFKRITSVVVAHDGRIVFEHYASGADASTLHDVRSASKTVTSMLVGAALERKLLNGVNDSAFGYFSNRAPFKNPDPRKNAVTLEDLLTMSSLLECNDENMYSSGNEERMYVTEDWIEFVLGTPIRGYAPWDQKPSESPYGRSFSYCTAGSFLLGAIVENVSGQTLGAFADETLFGPLGIQNTTWPVSPLGVYQGGGGLRLASRDYLKLGEVARNQGQWQGKQILPKAWIKQSTAPHVDAREGVTYGYQWWRFAFDEADIDRAHLAMAGNGGNYVFVHPASKLVTVITATAYGTNYMHSQSHKIYTDYVLKAHPDR